MSLPRAWMQLVQWRSVWAAHKNFAVLVGSKSSSMSLTWWHHTLFWCRSSSCSLSFLYQLFCLFQLALTAHFSFMFEVHFIIFSLPYFDDILKGIQMRSQAQFYRGIMGPCKNPSGYGRKKMTMFQSCFIWSRILFTPANSVSTKIK